MGIGAGLMGADICAFGMGIGAGLMGADICAFGMGMGAGLMGAAKAMGAAVTKRTARA
jgi:hypothetical protein